MHWVGRAGVCGCVAYTFQGYVAKAKANCPISRVLASTDIVLKSATLNG